MSFMFSKNRQKRSRSSTGESNSSFVKNVTSRVSGLLPAGITKWFSSPSSSSGNGSAAVAEGTDSSSDDEAPDTPITVPPAKRFRYSSPIRKNVQLSTSETTTTSNVVTDMESVLYTSIQAPSGRQAFRREPNFVSTSIRSPTHNEHTMSANTFMDRSEREQQYMQHTVSAIGQSIARKRKSLFDSDKQKEESLIACAKTAANQERDYKQPHFKPHLMGSPFYPGRTIYGGASASYSSPNYVTHPNIMQRKITYVNESKDAQMVNMSTSSRQVMDLLENYSSPLIEAKRIPRYELSELTDINRTLHAMPTSNPTAMRSFKSQELHIPTKASLIRMKAKSRVMNSTTAARQIIASHSSSLPFYQSYAANDIPQNNSEKSKSQSKQKSQITRTHGLGNPFEMPEPFILPTAVLRIDQNNLPSFSFGTNDTQPKKSSEPSSETFKFSSPLPATPDSQNAGSPHPAFNFGSPPKATPNTSPTKYSFGNQNALEKTETIVNKPLPVKSISDTQSAATTVITFAKTSNDWKCSDCWVSNKANAQKCVCCGSKQPSKDSNTTSGTKCESKCSTCKQANTLPNSDKCVNCEKIQICLKTSNSLAVTKNSSSKWKCGECWVDNEIDSEKCVCCGTRNQNETKSTGALKSSDKPDAPTERDWRCDDCLITNKPNMEKCAACGAAKPGTKTSLPPVSPAVSNVIIDNTFAEIVKSQKSSWECRVCLASNANETSACSCCETVKQGVSNDAPKSKSFKFNVEPNTGFKFGIDPKAQEINLAKKLDVAPAPKKLEESETNNNIVPKIPSFSLPNKKPEEIVDVPKTDEVPKPISKTDEAPKSTFTFGIPAQTASLATSFKAPSATKLPDIVKPAESKEKPHEVPSITFKAPEAKTSGWFSTPVTSNAANSMNAFLNSSAEKSVTISTVSSNSTPIAAETPKLQFSFNMKTIPGTGAMTNTGGLFSSSPASTLPQAAPASTAGLFAAPTSSAVSLFSKAVMTNAAAPASQHTLFQSTQGTPPAPIFSFGTSQSASTAATDAKPKFSFSVSNNSTPAFGAAQPAGNTLTNGPNPLAQSITGNGLSGASMFNAPAKENSMWPGSERTNQSMPFASAAPAKPAFSFGAASSASPFGASMQPVVFSGAGQPAQNMFGVDGGAQPMFAAGATGQPAPPAFGAPAPPVPMFDAAPPMATFDSPAPAFNFGAPQASGFFGFGQQGQQQSQQPMQPGSFGFTAPSAGQVQFAIGSAPNQGPAPARRIRKAVRRNR